MSDLENQLRQSLARRQPPAGFEGRVLRRLPPETRGHAPWMRWAAAMAAVLVMTIGGIRYQQYRKAEQATQQLMLALEIAAEKIAFVEKKVVDGSKQ